MNPESRNRAEIRSAKGQQQEQQLRSKDEELHSLATAGRKDAFFQRILPLLGPLKSYIKRRLRIAYLTGEIRTQVYTSGDILDQVVLSAYENYDRKPADLSLREWLYRLANETLDSYLRKRAKIDARRKSLESLSEAERRQLEEPERMTADAEGEVVLDEDLDDSEYQRQDFLPPTYQSDPSQELERSEEMERILRAFSRIPQRDRLVFELSAMEGFPDKAVARMTGVPAGRVRGIVEKVRTQVLRDIQADKKRPSSERKKAS